MPDQGLEFARELPRHPGPLRLKPFLLERRCDLHFRELVPEGFEMGRRLVCLVEMKQARARPFPARSRESLCPIQGWGACQAI
jgi:hypothetical protein